MKKQILFFSLIAVLSICLTSCSTQRMARFYVDNKTKLEVTDFQITWVNEDGDGDTIIIERIPKKTSTSYYAVFIEEVSVDFGKDSEATFFLSYKKGDKVFDFKDSKTLVVKDNGECWDPEAKFIADENYCIEITDDEYSIKLKK